MAYKMEVIADSSGKWVGNAARCAEGYARMMARAGDNGKHQVQSVAYGDAVKARR